MKLLNDYKLVLNYKLGKSKKTIEDVNDVILSSKYYPEYGEYGVENFLMFYADKVKKLLLERKLEKELPVNISIKCSKIKI